MTQADFTIANQTFPNTRTELNTSLQALATNSAGNSQPATTFPSQWWFDSDGNQLYIRNKDNDSWVKVVTIGATSDKIDSIADSISIASNGSVSITTSDNTDILSLISTDADASGGPKMNLYRNSSSPADNDSLGRISFTGRNDNSQDVVIAEWEAVMTDVSDGTEDGQTIFRNMFAGNPKPYMDFSSAGTVFNNDGLDVDFRVESNDNAHMLFVDASTDNVGIGSSSPNNYSGYTTITINNATNGGIIDFEANGTLTGEIYSDNTGLGFQAPQADDDIFFKGNDSGSTITALKLDMSDAGMAQFNSHGVFGVNELTNFGVPTAATLFAGTSNTTNAANDLTTVGSGVATNNIGVINDSNSGILSAIGMETRVTGAGRAAIHNMWQATYQSDLVFRLRTGSGSSGEMFRINSGEQCISTGAETSPDVTAGGLCLNQADLDTNILSFKSSDVAHGMTSIAETDTYATFEKTSSSEGGMFLETFSEGITNMMLFACSTSEQSTRSTSATGPVEIRGKLKSGTNAGAMGGDANILIIRNHATTRFIFDSDGDFHADSSSTTFDEYDDAQLARTFDISHGRGVVKSKFDKFISYNHEKLADLKLVGREDDGTPNHFINVTGMQRLHNGAIWQQYEKHQKLASAFYKLAEKTIGKEEADKLLTDEEIQLLN